MLMSDIAIITYMVVISIFTLIVVCWLIIDTLAGKINIKNLLFGGEITMDTIEFDVEKQLALFKKEYEKLNENDKLLVAFRILNDDEIVDYPSEYEKSEVQLNMWRGDVRDSQRP